MGTIDFDEIEQWGPWVGSALQAEGNTDLGCKLKAFNPEYIEDAGDFVVDQLGRESVERLIVEGLQDCEVRLYHGTRLSDAGAESVSCHGLLPLDLGRRRAELEEIFSRHPRWAEVRANLPDVLEAIGPGNYAGQREDDRIHVCFSKAGLLRGCSHYLCWGGEADIHIADKLFGDRSALALLRAARSARLVTFVRPFSETCSAANPYGVARGDLPALIRLLVNCWAFREARSGWKSASLKEGAAAWFRGPIPARDLEAIVDVADRDLLWDER